MWVCVKWDAKVKKNISFLKGLAYVRIVRKKKQKRARYCVLPVKCRIENTKRSMIQKRQKKETRQTGNIGKTMAYVLIVDQDHGNTDLYVINATGRY